MGLIYQLLSYSERPVYAAKLLLPGTDQKLFKREAETWFNLGEHSNIARPLWYGIWDRKCCIVMDWYENSLNSLNPDALRLLDIIKIFEWLTREHPFIGPENGFKFQPILRSKRFDKISENFGLGSQLIISAIKRCLSIDPADRPKTYGEIQSDLGGEGSTTFFVIVYESAGSCETRLIIQNAQRI
jgi:serine/threonine protein kinase